MAVRISRMTAKLCFLMATALLVISLLQATFHTQNSTLTAQTEPQKPRAIRLPSVCSNEFCRSDYSRQLHEKDLRPIPAIRHILWRNESVSEYFAEHLRSWLRIHPNWTYVLWRDQDLEPFVAAHFPGLLAKFKSLSKHIMRVDMFRYMLLFRYGGVYADLDYTLVRSMDDFRHFHAVVTREPEAHSLEVLSISWPIRVLGNPAFLMSAPGHIFFHYVVQSLQNRPEVGIIHFAGPFALMELLEKYTSEFPIASHVLETVYVPPSYSFYPYPDNRLNNSRGVVVPERFMRLNISCIALRRRDPKQQLWNRGHPLRQFCADVNNMDPITDRSQPVYAVHDLNKVRASYDVAVGTKFYHEMLMDARLAIPSLKLGNEFMLAMDPRLPNNAPI